MRRGKVDRVGRGWCNGSTGSFGVPSRGSKPRPRAPSTRSPEPRDGASMAMDAAMSGVPAPGRRGARRGRGHADALGDAQGAAPAVRPADAAPRRRRARRAAARADRGRRRPRRRAGHQDAAGADRHRDADRVRRAARPARHRRRRQRRRSPPSPTTSTSTATSSSCPATRRCCGPRRWPRWPREHRDADAAATLLTAELDDRHGLRPGRARRQGPGRPHRRADRRRPTRSSRSTRSTPSIYCFRRGLLAPALRRLSPENAQGEYYLTDVDRGAAPGRPRRASRSPPTTAPTAMRRQRPGPAGRGRGRAAARASTLRWMREGVVDGRPGRAPTSTPRSSSSPTCACSRARSSRAAPSSARGSVIGPDTQLVDTVVGERAVVRQTRSRARPRSATTCTVGPFVLAAARHPPRGRRARRHVRRDQERRDRRGRQGAAPRLRGRRRDRRRGQRRRRHHHRQLRRPRTSTARRSAPMRTIGSNTVLVAPVEVGDGAYTGAGAVVNRDVPPGALAKGVPAQIDEGWVAKRAGCRRRRRTRQRERDGRRG